MRGSGSGQDGCRRSGVAVMERVARTPGLRQDRSTPSWKEWAAESRSARPRVSGAIRCRHLRGAGLKGDCDCAHRVNHGDDDLLPSLRLRRPAPMRTVSPKRLNPTMPVRSSGASAGLRTQDRREFPDRNPRVSQQQPGPAAPGVGVSVRTLGCRTSVRSLLMWHPPW